MSVIGLKDNICTKSEKTTCGSKMLENFISPYNATIVEKLNNASKETRKIEMKEFGIEEDNYTKEFFENNGEIAIVTDLNGEIAKNSTNGRLGLKPTFGLVSRYGVVTVSPSLEQVGVIAKNANNLKETLDIIKGYDCKDSGSVEATDIENKEDIKKIGYIGDANLELNNLELIKIGIANLKYVKPIHTIISSAESSSNLARFDGIRYGYRTENAKTWKEVYTKTRGEGFGYEAKKKMVSGTFFLDVENMKECYIRAEKIRTLIKRELEKIFETLDAIAVSNEEGVLLANLTGRPAITLNGITIIGKHFSENRLIELSKSLGGAK